MLSQHAQSFLIEATEAELDAQKEDYAAFARYCRYVLRIGEFEFEPCECDDEIAANRGLDARYHNYGFCSCQCQRCCDKRRDPDFAGFPCLCESMQTGHGDPQGHKYGTCQDCSCGGCVAQRVARQRAYVKVRKMTVDQVRVLVRDDKLAVSDAILHAAARLYLYKAEAAELKARLQAHEEWLLTDAGKAHTAEKQAFWAAWEQENRRFWKELDDRLAAVRKDHRENGPYWGVLDSGNDVTNIRRLVAYATADPEYNEAYGRLFVANGKLVELRSGEDCSDPGHIEGRARNPEGFHCDAWCGSTFRLIVIRTVKQLFDVLDSYSGAAIYKPVEDWLAWEMVDRSPAGAQAALDSQRWPGTKVLKGVQAIPFIRLNDSVCNEGGWDEQSGFWAVEPTQQQEALESPQPTTLAGQLLELARGGGFSGSMTDLAGELNRRYGSEWSSKGLQCAIQRIEDKLRMLGVIAAPTGKTTGKTYRAEWAVAAKNNALYARDAQTSGNA